MTTLAEYLNHKRDAFRALRSRALSPGYKPVALCARVTAEGRSGVRRIRLRDHQVRECPEVVGMRTEAI